MVPMGCTGPRLDGDAMLDDDDGMDRDDNLDEDNGCCKAYPIWAGQRWQGRNARVDGY